MAEAFLLCYPLTVGKGIVDVLKVGIAAGYRDKIRLFILDQTRDEREAVTTYPPGSIKLVVIYLNVGEI